MRAHVTIVNPDGEPLQRIADGEIVPAPEAGYLIGSSVTLRVVDDIGVEHSVSLIPTVNGQEVCVITAAHRITANLSDGGISADDMGNRYAVSIEVNDERSMIESIRLTLVD